MPLVYGTFSILIKYTLNEGKPSRVCPKCAQVLPNHKRRYLREFAHTQSPNHCLNLNSSTYLITNTTDNRKHYTKALTGRRFAAFSFIKKNCFHVTCKCVCVEV